MERVMIAFTIDHGIRDSRSRIEEGGRTKVAGEEGRKTKQDGRKNDYGGGICVVTAVQEMSVTVSVERGDEDQRRWRHNETREQCPSDEAKTPEDDR